MIRATLVFSLVVLMCLSFKLWAGERIYPHAPLINVYINQTITGSVLSGLAVLCLLGTLLLRVPRISLFFGILFLFLLVLCDVNRLQWWLFLFGSMSAIFVVYNGRVDDPNRYTSYFIILQVMCASIYFFSGLERLISEVSQQEFVQIIEPLSRKMSNRQFGFFEKAGTTVPYFLMFTGISLMIPPIRYLGISIAVLIHIALLFLLFPHNAFDDSVQWTINISLLILLFLMFSGRTKERYYSPTHLFSIPAFYVTVILFVVYPIGDLLGKIETLPVLNYKVAREREMQITLSKEVRDKLPLYCQAFCKPVADKYHLQHKLWAIHELGTSGYAAEPAFEALARFVRKKNDYVRKGISIHITGE